MNILFLTSYLPYAPVTGALTRLYNNIKQARNKHNVVILSFLSEKEKPFIELAQNNADKIYTVPLSNLKKPKLGELLELFFGLPHFIAPFYSKEYRNILSKIIKDENIDLVHVDYLRMAKYIDDITVPAILDMLNVESDRVKKQFDQKGRGNIKENVLQHLEVLKLKKFENKYLRKYGAVLAITREDYDKFRSFDPKIKTVLHETVIDLDYFIPGEDNGEDAAVFTGDMGYYPNEDAVTYFKEDILLLLKRKYQNIKFYVVGRNPSDKLVKMNNAANGLVVTGMVEDVRPYVRKAKVFICPIRTGGGVKHKILEAMAMGKAIVTTSIGVEGIRGRDGVEYLVADKPADFADKVNNLLNDDKARAELGRAARKFVEENYSWDKRGEQLLQIYQDVYNGKS